MHYLFSQPQQSRLDLPITSWQDSVLAPKNQNIMTHVPLVKPFNRKQRFSQKRNNPKLAAKENQENIPNSSFFERTITNNFVERETSNLRKFKFKMQNLERDFDRWEEGSFKKIDKCNTGQFNRRVKSGFLKAQTEEQQVLTSTLNRRQFFHRSIEQSKHPSSKGGVRPNSCRQLRSPSFPLNPNLLITNQNNEKSSTIHRKSRASSLSYARKSKKGIFQEGKLTINQLQGSKMKQILKCLSQRKSHL